MDFLINQTLTDSDQMLLVAAGALVVFVLLLWVGLRVVKAAVRDGIRDANPQRPDRDWAETERQTL